MRFASMLCKSESELGRSLCAGRARRVTQTRQNVEMILRNVGKL